MTGTFKANNPYNNFLLFVYGLALKFPIFIYPEKPFAQLLDGVLYKGFLQYTAGINEAIPVFYGLLTFLLFYLQAILLNKLVNDFRLHTRPNYLAGMSYLLITSLFAEWYTLSSTLIVNTFLIWVWGKLCNLHSEPNPKSTIFNIGLVTGIAGFFYWPCFAFSILIMVGLTIARPFRLAEWLTGLVGLLTPFYFFASWLFLTGRWQTYRPPYMSVHVPSLSETRLAYIAIILIIIACIIGIFFINQNLRRQVVQTRKSWQLLMLYLFVAVIVPFLNSTYNISYFILMSVPLAYITATSFYYPDKKWYPLIMHWSMFAVGIIAGYFL